MAEHLVIRLSAADAQQASWVVADTATGRASVPESGPLDQAVRLAQQRPVTVIVPGEAVLLTDVELPVRGAARMLQAVPYALEEQLADDVQTLHFAVGRRHTDGAVPVAVVAHDLLAGWLQALSAVGLAPTRVVAETACLPAANCYTVVVDGPRALLRDPDGRTLAGDAENAATLVQALGAAPAADDTEASVYLSVEDAVRWSAVVAELRLLVAKLQVHELRDGVLPLLAAGAVDDGTINLLQGAYAPRGEAEKFWQPWRGAAMLAAALVLTALSVKSAEVLTLKAQQRSLNEQLNSIATESLPPGSRIVEPVTQLEQHARALRGAGGGSDHMFLEMLAALGEALPGGNTTIDKLDFRNGTLDITLDMPDVDTLDRIRRQIESRGNLSAEIQSANQRDERYQGRMRVRRGTS